MRFALLIALTVTSFFAGFYHDLLKGLFQTPQTPKQYPVIEQKAFVIIIPSYNNEKYIEKNIRSVFNQEYDNFRVIYIDDHSRDQTLKLAKQLLQELDVKQRTTLIHNPMNLGALANIYNAVHSCNDHEIIVLLDGDDIFAHDHVLSILNQAYAEPDVWATYGSQLNFPFYEKPKEDRYANKIIKKSSFRKQMPIASHLRTFYASLFKEIPLRDFYNKGQFFQSGWDCAILWPIFEMAKTRFKHIDQILYLHNTENPLQDYNLQEKAISQNLSKLRSLPPYEPLSALPSHENHKKKADLIIFSKDRPVQLYALLESIQSHVLGIEKISILYRSSTSEMEAGYLETKLQFPLLSFHKIDADFQKILGAVAFDYRTSKSPYLLFAEDDDLITDRLDLASAIDALETTRAYGFYFNYHIGLEYSSQLERYQPLPKLTPLRGLRVKEPLFAWQFSTGSDDWGTLSGISMALYRKTDLQPLFTKLCFDDPEELLAQWEQEEDKEKIGLCLRNAKSLRLKPSNLHLENLLDSFAQGLKIDIGPYFHIESPSQEISANLTLIPRE